MALSYSIVSSQAFYDGWAFSLHLGQSRNINGRLFRALYLEARQSVQPTPLTPSDETGTAEFLPSSLPIDP